MAFLNSLPLATSTLPTVRRRICTRQGVVVHSRSINAIRRTTTTVSMNDSSHNGDTESAIESDIKNEGEFFDVNGLNTILCGLMTGLIAADMDFGTAPVYAAIPEAVKTTFKTKPLSLAHPAIMWIIFASVLYTGWLGWQSRSIRSKTISKEKKKELVTNKVTRKHFTLSGSIMAIMCIFTFEGMANTYTRTGKLFPGPHLYAGLGLVALMTCMSALVPHMQSGKVWARNTHFALAVPTVAMFAWQANTGMVIVGKILGWK